MIDERFERGRKVAESLNKRAIGSETPCITGTGITEDDDMRYFLDRAVEEERRKAEVEHAGDNSECRTKQQTNRGLGRRIGIRTRRRSIAGEWHDRRTRG